MKIENFNIEKFRQDFFLYLIRKYNRLNCLSQFCKDYDMDSSTLWRALNGDSKNVTATHKQICYMMGKNVKYYLEPL